MRTRNDRAGRRAATRDKVSSRSEAGNERPLSGPARRLYQRAFDILAGQIEVGAIAPRARLRESGVAAQFGISRTPARQALIELERSGFVEKAEGRGYKVRGRSGGQPAGPKTSLLADDDHRLISTSTWERIYSDVEREIVDRISFAAWRVNEAELARYYGVSRTVARDVVARLQQRGVVRKDDRSRWYAPALTPDYVGELYELRWLLEPFALVKAAPHVAPAFTARMRDHLESAIANAHKIGGATLDALEEELHVALLRHCGQRALMEAITLSQSLLIAHRFLYRWTPRLFDTEPFLPEHMQIVEHLEAGDVDGAARSLGRHLRVSRDRAIARIDVIARTYGPDELPYLKRIDR
jgi:DNA-binding GntR family transcriptional regulator